MPAGKFKSRTYRRIHKRLPGGTTALTHEKRNPRPALCAKCGAVLKGIPRARDTKMKNLPKSKKTVERTYGGMLCSKCSRLEIINNSRKVDAK